MLSPKSDFVRTQRLLRKKTRLFSLRVVIFEFLQSIKRLSDASLSFVFLKDLLIHLGSVSRSLVRSNVLSTIPVSSSFVLSFVQSPCQSLGVSLSSRSKRSNLRAVSHSDLLARIRTHPSISISYEPRASVTLKSVTDRRTDGPTDRRTDEPTDGLL